MEEYINEIPKQTLGKLGGKREQDLALIEGGDGEPKKRARIFVAAKPKEEYAEMARAIQICPTNLDIFFDKKDGLVHSFGVQSEILARVGFDSVKNIWKFYIKKENESYNPREEARPSVLGFFLSEMPDLESYLMKTFAAIDEGNEKNEPFQMPKLYAGFKLDQPRDLTFWQTPDVWYSESGHCRIRTQWSYGSVYIFHMNQCVDGSKYPGYCGPKVRLSRKEAQDLIEIYRKIREKMPALNLLK